MVWNGSYWSWTLNPLWPGSTTALEASSISSIWQRSQSSEERSRGASTNRPALSPDLWPQPFRQSSGCLNAPCAPAKTFAHNNLCIPLAETCFRWLRTSVHIYTAVYFHLASKYTKEISLHNIFSSVCHQQEMTRHEDRDSSRVHL